jgi:hypothetical protein
MSGQAFTKNHRDHSNDNGFQFEFFCDKCGSGQRSAFKVNKLGLAASVLKAAGAIFGSGYHAGRGADHLNDAFRGPAWDDAFKEAIAESKPQFRQCTLCGDWVCPAVCWNHSRGLCEKCAPDLAEHAPAIQAQIAIDQALAEARKGDQLRGFDMNAAAVAASPACRHCQGTLPNGAKFCALCGTPAAAAMASVLERFCPSCGTKAQAGAQFCSGCGGRLG